MINRTIKIFVDFDGTITLEDVGEAIFKRFGNPEKVNRIIEDLLSDKISSRQCWDELCSSVDIVSKSELDKFVDMLEIDPTFNEFVKYCYFDIDSPTSANCKKNHIISHSSDDDYTIYIGDGNSDKEAAQYCDFIFAKNGLLKFCSVEKISFYPFIDFNDVKNKLSELVKKKNLRKRHQAQLKRKSAYMA